MNEKLNEFLEFQEACNDKYIFLGKGGFMGRGVPFECGPGWQAILEELFEELEKVRVQEKLEGFTVVQLKEKFGGLRVYTDYHTDITEELVTKAEEKAWKTCEDCGKPAKNKNVYGWYVTLCPEHLKEYEDQQKKWREDDWEDESH